MRRSAGASSTSCWPSAEHGIATLLDLQAAVLADRRRPTADPARGRADFVLATANPDKAAEIAEILGAGGDACGPGRPRCGDVEETGDTLVDNARLKARALVAATGLPAIADDTGLEVDALGGAPGVRSARFAGEDATYADNVAKLLDAARRWMAAAGGPGSAPWPWPPGRTVARWSPKGWSKAPSPPSGGGTGGFGYDPVFVPDEGTGGPSPR